MLGIREADRVVPERPIIDNWGASIIVCHAAAKELLQIVRKQRGDAFWDDFDWLAQRARRSWPRVPLLEGKVSDPELAQPV